MTCAGVMWAWAAAVFRSIFAASWLKLATISCSTIVADMFGWTS